MGIADISGQSRETKVDVSSRQFHILSLETVVPPALFLDLELQAQGLVLDVPELKHRSSISSTEVHLRNWEVAS